MPAPPSVPFSFGPRFLLGLALLLVLGVLVTGEPATASSPSLLSAAAAPAGGDPAADDARLRARFVRVDTDRLFGPGAEAGRYHRADQVMILNLFGDRALPVRRDGLQRSPDGGSVWLGHVAGEPGSNVRLALRDDRVAGSVSVGDELYQISHAADGVHVVRQVNLAAMPPYAEPIEVHAPPIAGSDEQGELDAFDAEADDGSIIDVMVLWTPAAGAAQGGTAAMEALIDLAVAETNQAYLNSGILPRINLVHRAEVGYSESGNFSTDLSRLRSQSDGYMDEIHALRDDHRADQVTLINNSTQYCGIAYLMSSVSSSFESSAFSVVYRGCATGYYSFGHELGHNQGSHHDHDNAGSSPAYAYSYGYQDPGSSFRTIMAYNCPSGCARVQHFSNPDVQYAGATTGVDAEIDPVNAADNARSIDQTAFTVANFRQSTPQEAPAAPSDLAAFVSSESSISLSWTDNAIDEDGFTLQRSPDGSSDWTTVATLPADSVGHSDSGLAASTTYYYRLRAFNSGGSSAWSALASATTDDPPPYVDQLTSGEIAVAGSIGGSYLDTHAEDQVTQWITERESGGKPSDRHSYLEHVWTVPVQAGDTVTLFVDAWAPASSDGDQFEIDWSTDNQSYLPAMTLTATADGGPPQSFALPPTTSGTLYLRLRDSDQSQGNRDLDTVYVDHLFVRSENAASGNPPVAPDGLTAQAISSSRVDLSWNDNAGDEYGFEVERSTDGSTWSNVGSTAADATDLSDETVTADTSYQYRVRAFNGSGSSAWSNLAQVTTPAGAAISMSLSGYKDKGNHVIELSWSGATGGQVEIHRDGGLLLSTANDGFYSDNTGNKGSQSYQYQVCEVGASVCSDPVDIGF